MADRFKFWRVNEITGTFVLVVVAVLIAAQKGSNHNFSLFLLTVHRTFGYSGR